MSLELESDAFLKNGIKKNTTNNNNLGKICLKLKNKIVYMYTHNISRTSQRLQENQAA